MTAFGARTAAIPIGGYGTFDGVMLNEFRRPRIEGTFAGEQMRAWDVDWGSAKGSAVIENSYVDVKDALITRDQSALYVDGRFSAGFPRRDGGEELNARIRVINRPVADLRHAFGIDDYDVDGNLSGEFHVYGPYQRPQGFGNVSLTDGVAYGESFDTALAAVRFEGEGVRLDNIQLTKNGGRGTGAAFIGWTSGSYSFNLDARDIPIESLSLARNNWFPLSGLLDFSAGGSGTFDDPRYVLKGTVRDLFAGDEGIGQVGGEIGVIDNVVTLKLEAASSRLAVSGTGRIELTPGRDADIIFRVTDTSLDPYVRALEPRLSPFTTAVASGTIRVVGPLADMDRLAIETTVEALDMRLFDYRLRNAAPLRFALGGNTMRLADVRLAGEDTALELSGSANLRDERMAVQVKGDANLGILQGFVSNIRASGRASLEATLEGSIREPLLTGTMTAQGGRIRHFGLPHALENILGPIRFDSRSHPAGRAQRAPGRRPGAVQRHHRHRGLPHGADRRRHEGRADAPAVPGGHAVAGRCVADAARHHGRGDAERAGGRARRRLRGAVQRRQRHPGLRRHRRDAPRPPAATPATALPLRYDIRIDAPVHAAGAQQQHPADGARRPPAARHLRSAAAGGPRRRRARRSDVRGTPLRGDARRRSTSATRRGSSRSSISKPKPASACPATPTASRCRRPGTHRPPEPGVQLRSLAAAGRDSGAAVQRRRAGAQHRVPAVQHRHHAAAAAAARARHARPDRAPSRRRSSAWCRRPSAWTPSS